MYSTRTKIVIIAGLIVLISSVSLWLGRDSYKHTHYLKSLLDEISQNAGADCLARADDYLRFLEAGSNAHMDNGAARAAADAYFQVAEAALMHDDALHQQFAIEKLKRSMEIFPSLRHGWPYFVLGAIYEKESLENPRFIQKAIHNFKNVSLYDFGELALRADYRAAHLKKRAELKWTAEDAALLLRYLRFASSDPINDLFSLGEFSAPDGAAGWYLRALAAQGRGDGDAARQWFRRYAKKNSSDYSVRYFQDQLNDGEKPPLYPLDGDLLVSCHAPLAYQDGGFRLLNDGRIRADFYAPNRDGREKVYFIQCEYALPENQSFRLHFQLNEQEKILDVDQRGEGVVKVEFMSRQEKNLFELHFMILDDAAASHEPLWLNLRRLAVSLPPEGYDS